MADDIVEQLARHLHPHHRALGDRCVLCEAAAEIERLHDVTLDLVARLQDARLEAAYWQKVAAG